MAANIKIQNSLRKICQCKEGSWETKERMFLPGEEPSEWTLCNYDIRCPNAGSNIRLCSEGLQMKP
jgi:hypothetical protein